ncbi:MAG TPA: hypothetical protein VGJ86_24920, partial [Acidimicrobiales bacterium]
LAGTDLGSVDVVGTTTVSDRANRTSHEIDVVAMRGNKVVAIGEAKLRRLGANDLDRLRQLRELIGVPSARLILASAEDVDPRAAESPDVIVIRPRDVYG